MKTKVDSLERLLERSLAPIYYVTGDEPFQLNQACDLIRQAAVRQGYTERQIYHVERGFDWQYLQQSSDNLSLFAQRKLLELRLGSSKPAAEGSTVLQHLASSPVDDTVVLVCGDKLDTAQQRSAWFTAIEAQGVVVQVWPVAAAQLPGWLQQRMQLRGLDADRDALQVLADKVEGNLLAADQEIEKLALLFGKGKLTVEQLRGAIADSSRFDIYSLADEALRGDAERTVRMVFGLQSEGTEPLLVLWALTREIRSLTQMAQAQANGQLDAAMARERVWDKRKPLVRAALQRGKAVQWQRLLKQCARLDRLAKGQGSGKIWNELLELALKVAGKPCLR